MASTLKMIVTLLCLGILIAECAVMEDCCPTCRIYKSGKTSYTQKKYVPNDACKTVIIRDRQQYKTKCGLFGWGRCSRYRTIYKTVNALKSVQTTLYRQNTNSYTCKPSCTCAGGPDGCRRNGRRICP